MKGRCGVWLGACHPSECSNLLKDRLKEMQSKTEFLSTCSIVTRLLLSARRLVFSSTAINATEKTACGVCLVHPLGAP